MTEQPSCLCTIDENSDGHQISTIFSLPVVGSRSFAIEIVILMHDHVFSISRSREDSLVKRSSYKWAIGIKKQKGPKKYAVCHMALLSFPRAFPTDIDLGPGCLLFSAGIFFGRQGRTNKNALA